MSGPTIYFDSRWIGAHGIGRYAAETRRRSAIRFTDAGLSGSASSPLDSVNLGRLRLPTGTILYSPGYNGGLSRCVQLLTVHDLIHLNPVSPRNTANRIYYDQVVRRIIRATGSVVTVSHTSADLIREWLGHDDVDVVVTGNGCSEAFRSRDGSVQSDTPYFVAFGNLRPHKNLPRALEAVAQVPGASLVMVGRDEEEYRRLATRAGCADRVTVMTAPDDETLAQLYRRATALLFPSLIEGFGLPVLEALSSGCPVIHLETCQAVVEIAATFPGGALAVADRTTEWADAISDMLQSRPAVPPVPSQYDWDVVAAALDDQLRQVAAAHGVSR